MDFSAFDRYRDIVDDWEAFVDALRRPLPTCIWPNTLRTDAHRLRESLGERGIDVEPLSWRADAFLLPDDVSPGNTFEYITGRYHVQEEAALLPVEFLELERAQRLLDLCAAPGNKTAQMSVAMGNRGTVIANDRNFYRLRAVRDTIDRLGLVNVAVTQYDGANYPSGAGMFDAVLVDAPCSCEGTTRKNPSALEAAAHGDPTSLGGVQTALLRKAFQKCRPGGRIVYATCTYAPEENECVVQSVLDERQDGDYAWVEARLPRWESSPGLTEWRGREFDEGMTNAMRVWPHQNDTGGFFVAAFERL